MLELTFSVFLNILFSLLSLCCCYLFFTWSDFDHRKSIAIEQTSTFVHKCVFSELWSLSRYLRANVCTFPCVCVFPEDHQLPDPKMPLVIVLTGTRTLEGTDTVIWFGHSGWGRGLEEVIGKRDRGAKYKKVITTRKQ